MIQCLILNGHLYWSGDHVWLGVPIDSVSDPKWSVHVWLGVSLRSDTKKASRVGRRLDYVLNLC